MGDRESEPSAATVSMAGVVEANEPFENPMTVRFGNSGSVVVDPPLDLACDGSDAIRDFGCGMAGGVVEQVGHGPGQIVSVGDDSPGRDCGEVNGDGFLEAKKS